MLDSRRVLLPARAPSVLGKKNISDPDLAAFWKKGERWYNVRLIDAVIQSCQPAG